MGGSNRSSSSETERDEYHHIPVPLVYDDCPMPYKHQCGHEEPHQHVQDTVLLSAPILNRSKSPHIYDDGPPCFELMPYMEIDIQGLQNLPTTRIKLRNMDKHHKEVV